MPFYPFVQFQNLDSKIQGKLREFIVCHCNHPGTILPFSGLRSNSEIAADAAMKSSGLALGQIVRCALDEMKSVPLPAKQDFSAAGDFTREADFNRSQGRLSLKNVSIV